MSFDLEYLEKVLATWFEGSPGIIRRAENETLLERQSIHWSFRQNAMAVRTVIMFVDCF